MEEAITDSIVKTTQMQIDQEGGLTGPYQDHMIQGQPLSNLHQLQDENIVDIQTQPIGNHESNVDVKASVDTKGTGGTGNTIQID